MVKYIVIPYGFIDDDDEETTIRETESADARSQDDAENSERQLQPRRMTSRQTMHPKDANQDETFPEQIVI